MKLLLLGDKESPYLWDYYQPGRLSEYDIILSAGDLSCMFTGITMVLMKNIPPKDATVLRISSSFAKACGFLDLADALSITEAPISTAS